jgi:hypothetical protein
MPVSFVSQHPEILEKCSFVLILHVKGYIASYKACSSLYNKVFKDLKLVDLQEVIDCGKNFPTLKKIKILFNQLYDFALKNDICDNDYSSFIDIFHYRLP